MDNAGKNMYEKLTIRDKFMFGKVTKNPVIAQKMADLLTPVEMGEVKGVEREKFLQHRSSSKYVKLDMYLEDENGRVVDTLSLIHIYIKEQVQCAAQALEKTVRVEQIVELANMAPEMQKRQGCLLYTSAEMIRISRQARILSQKLPSCKKKACKKKVGRKIRLMLCSRSSYVAEKASAE